MADIHVSEQDDLAPVLLQSMITYVLMLLDCAENAFLGQTSISYCLRLYAHTSDVLYLSLERGWIESILALIPPSNSLILPENSLRLPTLPINDSLMRRRPDLNRHREGLRGRQEAVCPLRLDCVVDVFGG